VRSVFVFLQVETLMTEHKRRRTEHFLLPTTVGSRSKDGSGNMFSSSSLTEVVIEGVWASVHKAGCRAPSSRAPSMHCPYGIACVN